jgi:RNA polymerase sigma-70 factor (ECF subfamily)
MDECCLEENSKIEDKREEIIDHLTIMDVVKQLPQEERELIELVFIDEFTYNEIEQITGISVGTIKSKMFYLKKKLRPLLKEYGRDHNGS